MFSCQKSVFSRFLVSDIPESNQSIDSYPRPRWDTGGYRGYRGLQEDTGGYRGIHGDTGGYRGIQHTRDTGGYRRIQGDSWGYRGIQGDTGGYRGIHLGDTAYKRYRGIPFESFSIHSLIQRSNTYKGGGGI